MYHSNILSAKHLYITSNSELRTPIDAAVKFVAAQIAAWTTIDVADSIATETTYWLPEHKIFQDPHESDIVFDIQILTHIVNTLQKG